MTTTETVSTRHPDCDQCDIFAREAARMLADFGPLRTATLTADNGETEHSATVRRVTGS